MPDVPAFAAEVPAVVPPANGTPDDDGFFSSEVCVWRPGFAQEKGLLASPKARHKVQSMLMLHLLSQLRPKQTVLTPSASCMCSSACLPWST